MSSKVDDFGTNRKRVCEFLLVIISKFGPLASFLRYGDLLAENCVFFLPLIYSTPRSLSSLSNFTAPGEVKRQETKSHGDTLWRRLHEPISTVFD